MPDGTKISLGGSLLENTTSESATYTNGSTSLTYTKTGKNQSAGIGQLAGILGTASAVKSAANSLNIAKKADTSVALKTAAVPKNPNIIPKNPNIIPINPNLP